MKRGSGQTSCSSLLDIQSNESSVSTGGRHTNHGIEIALRTELSQITASNLRKLQKLAELKTQFQDLTANLPVFQSPDTYFAERLAGIKSKIKACDEENERLEYLHTQTQQSLVSLTQLTTKTRTLEVESLLQRLHQHHKSALSASQSAHFQSFQVTSQLSSSLTHLETARHTYTESLQTQRKLKRIATAQTHQSQRSLDLCESRVLQTTLNKSRFVSALKQCEMDWKRWRGEKKLAKLKVEEFERGMEKIAL